MKKTVLFCASALAFAAMGCGGNLQVGNQNNNQEQETQQEFNYDNSEDYPWVFDEGLKSSDYKVGQTVLSIHTFYENKIKESNDPSEDTYIFYSGKVESIDGKFTVIDGKKVPNSVVIPIPEGQTAKKGDIVLTWWQSGSGMQRAIVTDDSNPKQPKVCYLDLDYKDDGKGFANEHANEQLKPNSFVVLKDGAWEPGQTVTTTDHKNLILINCNDDLVLCSGFAGKICAYYRQYCSIVPLKQNLQPGDQIRADFVGEFKDGATVKKVDESIGRVWITDSFGSEKVLSILDVYKDK